MNSVLSRGLQGLLMTRQNQFSQITNQKQCIVGSVERGVNLRHIKRPLLTGFTMKNKPHHYSLHGKQKHRTDVDRCFFSSSLNRFSPILIKTSEAFWDIFMQHLRKQTSEERLWWKTLKQHTGCILKQHRNTLISALVLLKSVCEWQYYVKTSLSWTRFKWKWAPGKSKRKKWPFVNLKLQVFFIYIYAGAIIWFVTCNIVRMLWFGIKCHKCIYTFSYIRPRYHQHKVLWSPWFRTYRCQQATVMKKPVHYSVITSLDDQEICVRKFIHYKNYCFLRFDLRMWTIWLKNV